MKKLDQMMHDVDETFDKVVTPALIPLKRHFTVISTSILIILVTTFFIKIISDKPSHLAATIKNDLSAIEKALNEIDKECNILSFTLDNVPVDFLNVQKFSGSTVGCMNLAYPAKWSGPYMRRNPTLQGRFYEICKTRDGLFIVPGHGVKLPTKQIKNKTFVIDATTSMAELVQNGGPLNYKGEVLTIKINFKIGDWDSPMKNIKVGKEKTEKINNAISEFNQAFSFTRNSAEKTMRPSYCLKKSSRSRA